MNSRLLKKNSLAVIACFFVLTALVQAQVTAYQEEQWLNTPAASSHIGNLNGDAHRAALTYRRYCLVCHGQLGDGNGESAYWFDTPLYFKPRDFTLGIFKCRSTPTGTLPTDQDIADSIARGLDRSNMPPWNVLTNQERADLVAWIKHYSPRWQTEKSGPPLVVPPEPEVTAERVKAGQEVYSRVQCWKCHGVTGEANGPSASTLQDDLGHAILPYNFSEGGRFKCGVTDGDLYKIFMTGLDGTPMPSYSDNIKPEEAWDLVFYLRTLQPFHTKAKEIADQIHLKPLNSDGSLQK
jgi:mono/diheme cytochrome c family protein